MKSESWIVRASNWLLSRIYDEELFDEIEGDFRELHEDRIVSVGKRKANLLYAWDAIKSIRNTGLTKKKASKVNQLDMLINNLKFSIRIFKKDKFFSTLNILGLSLGIAVSILLLLIVQQNISYDKHYANHENIYRVGAHETAQGLVLHA